MYFENFKTLKREAVLLINKALVYVFFNQNVWSTIVNAVRTICGDVVSVNGALHYKGHLWALHSVFEDVVEAL